MIPSTMCNVVKKSAYKTTRMTLKIQILVRSFATPNFNGRDPYYIKPRGHIGSNFTQIYL